MRQWLDQIEITDQTLARFLSKIIPGQCPFERDLKLFGHLVLHIPPLCKLNPLYEQLASLRFRALCYLVDQCGEDIQFYAWEGYIALRASQQGSCVRSQKDATTRFWSL